MKERKKISKLKALFIIASYLVILSSIWYGFNEYLIQKSPQLSLIQKHKDNVKENPNDAGNRSELAVQYLDAYQETLHKSYLKKAKQQYEAAIELEHNNTNFRYGLAETLKLMNDKGAIKQYKEIIKINPLDVQANFELGAYYEKNKDFNRAIAHYQKCLELEPTAANVYFELGTLYEKQKDKQKALQMFEMTKKFDPMYEGIDQELERLSEQIEG